MSMAEIRVPKFGMSAVDAEILEILGDRLEPEPDEGAGDSA